LENAAGIATLTDMGLNKWKVTRIGHANGIIKLRSHTSTNVKFEKAITVGGDTQIVFDEMNYLQEVGDGINFGGRYQFKVLPRNGNFKFTGNLKVANLNTALPTTYTWSLVSKTGTHYTFGWNANGRSVEAQSN